MVFFLVIGIVLLLVPIGAFLISKQYCWKELAITVAVLFFISGISALICYHSNTSDTEIWNGVVTSKSKERVSCSHSYSCNCRNVCTGSGNNRSCSQVCDTCYEHINDWDWRVNTSIDESVNIQRIDRRGSDEPPRWTKVRIGEPFSSQRSYTNYIKAAPDTLFRHQGLQEKYKVSLPDYPDDVHDYYRLNRVVLVGSPPITEAQKWNESLSELNSRIGSQKQVNIILVLSKNKPRDWFYALEEKWVGGKKNDVVLVANLDDTGKPMWVEVMAWTTHPLFKIKLRDSFLELTKVEKDATISLLEVNILKYHKRKPMADFEYLKASITPSVTQWIVTLILGLLIASGLSWFFHHNEVFPEYRKYY